MAIIKKIELDSGVTVNYHRIASIRNIINKASVIEVFAYTSKEKRDEEKEKMPKGEPIDLFIDTKYFGVPYDSKLDVTAAYDYIKSLDMYKDSTDDL